MHKMIKSVIGLILVVIGIIIIFFGTSQVSLYYPELNSTEIFFSIGAIGFILLFLGGFILGGRLRAWFYG
jgi:hypothetical protein